jgi:putative FmdB family regulatory protein
MPLFEYECENCKTRFEQLVFNHESEIVCRNCGSSKVTQLLSVFSVAATQEKCAPESGPCTSCSSTQRGICGMS